MEWINAEWDAYVEELREAKLNAFLGALGRQGCRSNYLAGRVQCQSSHFDAISTIAFLAATPNIFGGEQPYNTSSKSFLASSTAWCRVIDRPKLPTWFCGISGFNARTDAWQIQPKSFRFFLWE